MDLLMILKITSVRLIEQIKKDTLWMVVYDHVELKCREEVRQSLSIL